jgi:hypothetical protein
LHRWWGIGLGRVVADFVVNSEPALQAFIGDVRELWRNAKWLQIAVKVGTKRSLDQNALVHVWYQQMAREDRQEDERGHTRYCKLHHGVPILRSEDAEFRSFYDKALMGLTYEDKLGAMDYMPVTRLMTKAQLNRYLQDVRDDYMRRGVHLEFPSND